MRLIAATAFSTVLLLSSTTHAADGGGSTGGGSTPSRAPLGAPPSNEATDAYRFRAGMGVDPQCQELSQEADRIFMDSALDMEAKVKQLDAVKLKAQKLKCV